MNYNLSYVIQLVSYGSRLENNLSNLARLSIAGPLDLVRTSLSEANAKHPQCVIICRLDINMGFNQSLPFPHQGPQLISCKVHALIYHRRIVSQERVNMQIKSTELSNSECRHYPEIGQDISTLDIFTSQTDLPVGVVLITLKVSKRCLKHSMLETF